MPQANQVIVEAERAFEREEWREAAELYSIIVSSKNAAMAHRLNYFYALEHAGRPDVAKSAYLDLSYRHPLAFDAHLETGLFFQRQRKNLEASIFFGRALCVEAEGTGALQALEAIEVSARDEIDHCCLSGGLAGDNKCRQSGSLLKEVLIWPTVQIAMAAMRRKDWAKAEACFRKILKIAPYHVAMLVQCGHCLREQGAFTRALGTYRRAILLAPRDPDVYLHLGHTLKAMEHYQSALDAYSTALTLRPALVHAQTEIEALERFLQSRGIAKASSGRFEQQDRTSSPSSGQRDWAPDPGLSDRQKIIFNQLSNALALRD